MPERSLLRIHFVQHWFNLSILGWKKRCMTRERCDGSWGSTWGESRCRTRTRFGIREGGGKEDQRVVKGLSSHGERSSG